MPTVAYDFIARGTQSVREQVAAVSRAARRATSDATKLEIAERNNASRAAIAAANREARAKEVLRRSELQALARIERERKKAEDRAARDAARDAARATAIAEREANKRLDADAKSARARTRELMKWAESVAKAEKRATEASEREAQRRARADERARGARAREWGQRGQQLAGQAFSIASSMHGQIQGARRSRAETEHTLNSALYQAGVTGAEASGMRARVFREVESGRLQGLSADEVASAIAATQTQFSSLTRGTEGLTGQAAVARRQQNLSDMLGAAEFARNTYQGPGEVMRVAGMLSSQGVTGDNQRAALEAMTGIAQAGSIELANVTRESLGPLMQNIAVATARLGADASPEARATAVREATVRTLAVGEVGAGAGLSSRDALNAYAKIQRGMQSDVVTGHLFEALGARRGGSALARELFTTERDSRGQTVHRMRAGQDALGVMGRLQTFAGGSTQLANLLQGGGGEAMILDAQVRRFLGGLSSQTAGGQTMAQRIQQLVDQGRSFGQADVNRGASMVNAEQRTQITAQDERRNAALTMDSAATRFSNAVDAFAHNNPFASSALSAAAGGASSLLAGGLGRMAGATGAGGIASTIAGGGAAAGGASSLLAGGLGRMAGATGAGGAALGTAAGVIAAGAVGLGAGDLINDEIMRRTTGRNENGTVQDTNTFSIFNDGLRAFADELRTLPDVLSAAFARAGSTHAATNAAAVARTEAAARQNRT